MAGRITIAAIGHMAAPILAGSVAGRVVAVFDTTFYIETDDGRFVCIGTPDLGNGPLNAISATATRCSWHDLGVRQGRRVSGVEGGFQIAGGARCDCSGAAVWTPPPWPQRYERAALRVALDRLEPLIAARAPYDGLGRLGLAGPAGGGLAGTVMRQAVLLSASLADWLSARLAGNTELDAAARTAVAGLVGLGPGLTPSGDDLLAGLAIALHAAGESTIAGALGAAVASIPAGATGPLSRALLDAAILGQPSEVMHDMIATLVAGDCARIPACLERAAALGHTSGWDMLAGARLALTAIAAT